MTDISDWIDYHVDPDVDTVQFDEFSTALMGVCCRKGSPPIMAYDRAKCIQVFVDRDGMTPEDAEEFFEFNYEDAWLGDGTPCFIELSPQPS